MDSVVNLKDPFTYPVWPILLLLLGAIAVGITYLLIRRKKEAPPVEVPPEPQQPRFNYNQKTELKAKYVNILYLIEQAFRNGEISAREAYQRLSVAIRDFLKEISGVDVTKCTLMEMRSMRVPIITQLIEGYYEPEFAVETDDDVIMSITSAKKVIERWI